MCHFKSGIHQYFSKIAHCAKDTVTEPKTQYAVNVNFLHNYFNASELIPDNQQLLDSMPELLLPNLTFQERELTESAGLLSTSLFDMTKLAQASLNDSQVFLDVGSIIADSLQKTKLNVDMTFSLRTIETIFTFLNPIISGLALFGFIRMYFKFQAITAALMLIRPPAAHAASFQKKLWLPDLWKTPRAIVDQPQNVYTLPPLKALDLETLPVSALILGILVLILFLMVLRRITPLIVACCKRIGTTVVKAQSNDTFKISISIGNEEKYISLILMELPFAAQEYKFQARRFLSGLRVQGHLRPVLQITWPQLTITHKYAPLTYSIIKVTNLSHMQAYHLRKILKKPHFVLFHLKHGNKASLILPLEGQPGPQTRKLQSSPI
jgi:hypothetical protein